MGSPIAELLAEKNVFPTTLSSYRRLLEPISSLTLQHSQSIDALLRAVPNTSTRRAAAIALRSIGLSCQIPRRSPLHNDLPDEESVTSHLIDLLIIHLYDMPFSGTWPERNSPQGGRSSQETTSSGDPSGRSKTGLTLRS